MNFAYKSFTQEDIVHAINESLQSARSRIKVTSFIRINDNVAQLRTSRGATLIAILGSFSPSTFFIRGLHRIRRRFEPFTYLFNGQAGKNLDSIAFFGENGKIFHSSKEAYENWLKEDMGFREEVIERRIKDEAECNPRIQEALSNMAKEQ